MKLKYHFELVEIGDEISAVPVGDGAEELHGVLQLNAEAAEMLTRIAESETPEEAHQKLMAEHPDEDFDEVGQKLCDFLNQLAREGILLP